MGNIPHTNPLWISAIDTPENDELGVVFDCICNGILLWILGCLILSQSRIYTQIYRTNIGLFPCTACRFLPQCSLSYNMLWLARKYQRNRKYQSLQVLWLVRRVHDRFEGYVRYFHDISTIFPCMTHCQPQNAGLWVHFCSWDGGSGTWPLAPKSSKQVPLVNTCSCYIFLKFQYQNEFTCCFQSSKYLRAVRAVAPWALEARISSAVVEARVNEQMVQASADEDVPHWGSGVIKHGWKIPNL